MALIVKTKTKQQEKAVKAFLDSMDIDFTKAEEEEAPYRTSMKRPPGIKEKKILNDLDKSVDFVNKNKKGKQKLIDVLYDEQSPVPEWQKQEVRRRIKKYNKHPALLIDEKTAMKIINQR